MNRYHKLLFICALAASLLLGGCSAPDHPSISLYLAVQRGDIDQVERHIHWGTDINTALSDGRAPLQHAVEYGGVVMVRLLLDNGAVLDARDSSGISAIDQAILTGRTQVAEVLRVAGAAFDPNALLLKATHNGVTDRDILRYLLRHGADLEAREAATGDTALLIAVRNDYHRLARHLVDQGAQVNVRDRQGHSALRIAREAGYKEIVSLLERFGATTGFDSP